MSEQYLTVAARATHELEVRRSVFICALAPVSDEGAAREFIAERRKADPSARHHCHAFVLGIAGRTQRSSDDGEPAGTAGVPMLEVLVRKDLTEVVAVVTRHFGGIKLGAGGLVRAYGEAVSEAVNGARLVRRRRLDVVSLTVDYAVAGKLENELHGSPYPLLGTEFGESAHFSLGVPPAARADFDGWLAAVTGGAAVPVDDGERWV
jgi:uncharacterized YigZ family protein